MTTILITGANRGIGFELAHQSLEKGWTVYGSARRSGSGAYSELCMHPQFHELVFDVTDHAAVQAAAGQVAKPIDILVNNAGIIGQKPQSTVEMDFAGFAQTLAVNTIAPLAVVQAFLPHLKRSARGRILTISSRMGSMSHQSSDRIAYRASKAAVNKVMQGLAIDLKPLGIAVASIHPGWVQTDMGGAAADITPQKSANGILRIAEALDISRSGSFLNWDGSSIPW